MNNDCKKYYEVYYDCILNIIPSSDNTLKVHEYKNVTKYSNKKQFNI